MIEKSQFSKRLARLELSNKPTLYITEKLQKQIDFLHNKVKGNEWSGELITREVGTINDLDDWKIYAEDIFLADVGTPGSTSYEVDKGGFKAVDVVEMYEKFEGLLDGSLKNQHIHTHHSMAAFFSGTDWENLEDRSNVSNYTLMLVVNFDGKYCAKVAFKAKIVEKGGTSIEFANNADNLPGLKMDKDEEIEKLVIMDCAIIRESPVVLAEEWFTGRYDNVKKAIEDKKPKVTYFPAKSKKEEKRERREKGQGTFFPGSDAYDTPSWEAWKKNSLGGEKTKKISEMTEKEWKEYSSISENAKKREEKKPTSQLWQTRHVFALLNAVINKGHDLSFASPIPALSSLEREFRDKKDREEWLIGVQFNIHEKFVSLFHPKTTDDNYVEMLWIMLDVLDAYKYIELVDNLLDLCWDEMERFEKDPVEGWNTFNKQSERSPLNS